MSSWMVARRLSAPFSVLGGKNSKEMEGRRFRKMSEICMVCAFC